MEIFSAAGLIIAVAVLMIGAYKGLGALPLTLLAALVVIITSGMPIWEGYATFYMGGYTGAYLNNFLLFAASSLYAEFMNVAGSASTIGYKFIDWFGKDRVLLVSVLIISVLTYGGVSLFVVVFAVAPIMFLLFKEADIPRHLTMGALILGSATFTMTALPGSPALTNVIPTQFLGTSLIASPVIGVIAALLIFGLGMIYLTMQARKAKSNGERWTEPDEPTFTVASSGRDDLPSSFQAFTPLITLVLVIIVGSQYIDNSTMLATIAMIIGAVLTYALNYSRYKNYDMKALFTKGLGGGISSIGGLAAVVAFGSVVQNSPAFSNIVTWLLGLDINAYLQGVIATAAIAGVTGSSSGGLIIMYESLADHFTSLGINLNILHRLTSLAAGSLDTLPHSPGLFLMLPYLGLTHKKAYKHVFATSVLVPALVVAILVIVVIVSGI